MMGENKSFDATDFFAGQPNLPTILESDEVPKTFTSSPLASPPMSLDQKTNAKSNTTTTLPNGTRSNTPDTDETAVEVGNSTTSSPKTPSRNSSRSNTPSSEKGSKRSNKSTPSSPVSRTINSRSNTPDINRLSRRVNREATSTPTGSRTPSRSRSNTPDISKRKNTTGFLQTENHEMKPIREPLTSSNFIHLGVPGEINFPSANIRELTIGVFHVFNPTEHQISWSLTPAENALFRRLGTATNAATKVDDDIFLVTKPRGFLGPKHAERVDVHFRPLGVGTYIQKFVLEDASGNLTNNVDAVSMSFQGIATENTFSTLLQKHKPSKKEVKFEVEGSEVKLPPTRVGKQRSMGIKISNVSKESVRLNCKVETSTGPGGKYVLSLPMNSVVIKSEGFAILPVRFQPRAEGEVKGIVTIQSAHNNEVKVDIFAKGVLDNRHTI